MTLEEAIKARDDALFQAKTERMRNNILQQRWLRAVAEEDKLRAGVSRRGFLSLADLQAGIEISSAATPGPWEQRGMPGMACDFVAAGQSVICCHMSPADAKFVAAAREAVPVLIDQVMTLNKIVLELEERLREVA